VGALDLIQTWDVPVAAAAVVGTGGVLAATGPVDRPFPLASVSKVLTALTVLVAVEEGSVALDEPAGPPGSTVRHLLAHASGLGPEGADPVTEPGARRIYSNAGFEVLAAHLEARTGIPFATYLHEALVEPLALMATRLEGSPAHGAVSTAADLAVVAGQLLVPTLVAGATIADATTVQVAGLTGVLPGFGRQDPNDWGLGFELRDGKQPHWTGSRNSPATFGHFGRSGTFLWVDPAAAVALVVLTDRQFGEWAVREWPVLSDAVLAEFAATSPG
jgi:CubicO group peptidase (beta-lactamase class C family)